MTLEDAIYALLLFLSLCLGPLIQRSTLSRLLLPAIFGFLMASFSAGLSVWHSVLTVFGFTFLLLLCPARFFHYVACVWCFGYLGFFRSCHYMGLSKPSDFANVVQLLITLRLIGLSFELFDTWKVEQQLLKLNRPTDQTEQERLTLLKEYKGIRASPLEVLCYAYCYVGLFSGPYYKFRTFFDFVNWPPNAPAKSTDQLVQQLQEVPLFGVSYFILSHFYTVDCDSHFVLPYAPCSQYVRLDDFYQHSFAYRFFYMVIIFFIFRLRIYFAWKLGECVCMSAGFGAYPTTSEPLSGEGPTNLVALNKWMLRFNPSQQTANSVLSAQHSVGENSPSNIDFSSPGQPHQKEQYSYSTIQNISVWGCEFTPTVREGMRSWNQTVQYWLAFNFHKRFPGSRSLRYVWTMCVSAYWHGLHPGYYLSFLTIPLALVAESGLAVLVTACGRGLPPGSLNFFSWLLKMRVFEYCAMGFLLLDAHTTLAYWHSIGYCVHCVLFGIILLSAVVRRVCPKSVTVLTSAKLSPTEQLTRLTERGARMVR
ncbi:lysophospholipid acyltransferase 7 [Paragonimus westermani]|uniref:Lysophospholipid acyltransferase 7 n=1 Tax=Paragonimus westermani TaxID=34504 RepID=A0A5J4P2T3_9TREM|nr:lysophospholipid acyltransferase 7 [Paragonimus westermani]